MKRTTSTLPLLLTCTALAAVYAHADFTDNFHSGDNAWTRYSPLTPFGTPASFSFPGAGYQISAPQSLAPIQLGDGRGASFVTGESYGDFSLSVDLIAGGAAPQFAGAFVRVSTPVLGTLNGYAVGYDYGSSRLTIYKLVNEASVGAIGAQATSPVLILHSSDVYTISYTALGSFQQATLTDKTTGLLVTTVSGTDSTYSRGQVGLGVALSSTAPGLTASETFGHFSVVTIPEPETWALVLVGLGAMTWVSRRQCR